MVLSTLNFHSSELKILGHFSGIENAFAWYIKIMKVYTVVTKSRFRTGFIFFFFLFELLWDLLIGNHELDELNDFLMTGQYSFIETFLIQITLRDLCHKYCVIVFKHYFKYHSYHDGISSYLIYYIYIYFIYFFIYIFHIYSYILYI